MKENAGKGITFLQVIKIYPLNLDTCSQEYQKLIVTSLMIFLL